MPSTERPVEGPDGWQPFPDRATAGFVERQEARSVHLYDQKTSRRTVQDRVGDAIDVVMKTLDPARAQHDHTDGVPLQVLLRDHVGIAGQKYVATLCANPPQKRTVASTLPTVRERIDAQRRTTQACCQADGHALVQQNALHLQNGRSVWCYDPTFRTACPGFERSLAT